MDTGEPHSRDDGAPAARFWRDGALAGAWLMSARYRDHRFERHLHDELVVAVTESGSGEAQTRRGTERSHPGSVWVFAAGEYHSGRVCASEGWAYRALYLDDGALKNLAPALGDAGAAALANLAPGLHDDAQLARLLCAAHGSLEVGAGTAERQALWWQALALLAERHGGAGAPGTRAGRGSARAHLRRARAYIDAHYRSDFSIEELSQAAGLSRFHLMRSFREEYGLPPHAYANQLRLIAAKRMLRAGHAAAEVAADVGFYDQSHMTRLFKRAFDLTPGRFAALGRAG